MAAGADGLIGRQALIGALAVTQLTDREVDASTWPLDDGADLPALATLAALGARTVLVPADSVALDDELERDDTMTRPFSLDVPVPDGAGSPGSLLGLAYDDVVSEALDAAGASAGTRAHRATTLLMASWFDADPAAGAGPAAAVRVGPDTGGATLELLSSTLNAGGPLEGRRGTARRDRPDSTHPGRRCSRRRRRICGGPSTPSSAPPRRSPATARWWATRIPRRRCGAP